MRVPSAGAGWSTSTLTSLLREALGSQTLDTVTPEWLRGQLERLEQSWRRRLAQEWSEKNRGYPGREPPAGTPDRSTLERAIPVLRAVLIAREAADAADNVIATLATQIAARLPQHDGAPLRAHLHRRMAEHGVDLGRDLRAVFPASPELCDAARALTEPQRPLAGSRGVLSPFGWTPEAVPVVLTHGGAALGALAFTRLMPDQLLALEQSIGEELRAVAQTSKAVFELSAFVARLPGQGSAREISGIELLQLAASVTDQLPSDVAVLCLVPSSLAALLKRHLGASVLVAKPAIVSKGDGEPAVWMRLQSSDQRREDLRRSLLVKVVAGVLVGLGGRTQAEK